MAKFNYPITNFLGGELGPKAYARVDAERYRNSLKECLNKFIYTQGGVGRRPGSESMRTDFAGQVALLPFVISKTESYLVILQQSSSVLVLDTNDLTLHSASNRSLAATGFVQHSGYTAAQLQEVQWTTSGDVMIITHGSKQPILVARVLNAQGGYDFQSGPFHSFSSIYSDANATLGLKWPYRKLNLNATNTFTPSANWNTTGSKTITAVQATFNSGHVGSMFVVLDAGEPSKRAYCVVTAVATNVSATFNVINTNMDADATAWYTWYESAWSDYRGWPRTCQFFQQRLCYGGNAGSPDTVWCSEVGDILQLTDEATQLTGSHTLSNGVAPTYPAAMDTDEKKLVFTNDKPFNFTLNSQEVNLINWMSAEQSLAIGTAGREYLAKGTDPSLGFGPFNIDVRAVSSKGSSYVQAVRIQNAAFFVDGSAQRVINFAFDYQEETAKAVDISQFADHIFKKGLSLYASASVPKILNIQYQGASADRLFGYDNNGVLWSATVDLGQGVVAWQSHKLGGTLDDETPKILSMAITPNRRGDGQDVWLLVNRTVNSSTVYHIERISKDFESLTMNNSSNWIQDKPVYMDACKFFKKSSDATFYANYNSSVNATTSGGSGTGTVTGSAAVSGGRLVMGVPTPAVDYVDYDGTSNVDSAQTGCIRFKYRPGYSTLPAANISIFAISKSAASDDNLITLVHNTSNNFVLTINNSAGAAIINGVSFGNWPPIASTSEQIFELNYDLTNGATRLFINGKQFGSTITSTGTRDTSIDLLRIGSNRAGTANANHSIDDFQFFSTVQHTADHSPVDYWAGGATLDHLDYLEGESVSVLIDGIYVGEFTVTSGAITLPDEPSSRTDVLVGLNYRSLIQIMPIEAGSVIGTAQGELKRLERACIRFNRTVACKVGRSTSSLEEIPFREVGDAMNAAIPLFTGDKIKDFLGDNDRDGNLVLVQDSPFPWQVTGLFLRGTTNEG